MRSMSQFRCSRSRIWMDDNMSDVQFFEGVEKLLEIWFSTNDNNSKHADLRKIPRSRLESLLKIVRCEIISFCSNDQIDAYVLSLSYFDCCYCLVLLQLMFKSKCSIVDFNWCKCTESSMFISKRRFILKTCGTTTPLLCLQPLLLLVEQYAGFTDVEDVFYSRKNYKRPDLQAAPHRDFYQEVTLLDAIFPHGSAYCLGSMNRDCWYLYTLNPPRTNALSSETEPDPDQTLEILMTDLDPDVMSIFTREECLNAAEATKKSGIDKIVPNMVIDDYLFEPCGYSMNGVTKSGCYMTIHITPEPEFSYVSFETNITATSYREIVNKVIETFQPGKFMVTVFTNKTSAAVGAPKEIQNLTEIGSWTRRDMQHICFKNYDLTYAFYSKFPS
ncbi:S-adenosylmethionine decarboxylase proenzyme isoform X2 [Agrilus planipennis]|uniref:S-adenosylmethionine decarboxylase proenzyme n=1 Tax=Agrilus planipennis TaxID=224129 RepID=A0A7F5R370_AGRPL|nr:S-adenosylmethionine decarboxylase proenzyme isoform X2 [Agrilus planipennis]